MSTIFGTKWGDPALDTPGGVVTWSIIPGGTSFDSSGLTTSTVTTDVNGTLPADYITQLRLAFEVWARAADIEFLGIQDQGGSAGSGGTGQVADIRIGGTEIDGGSGTLAFAFGPQGGDVFFDTEENWSSDFFFRTALHEIGHAIGLDHVDISVALAVMNPIISNFVDLQPHDIADVLSIYGADLGGGGALATLDYVLPATVANLTLITPARDNADVNLTGNALNNTLGADASDNVLSGLGGKDSLFGNGGNDTLIGGTGSDVLNGGAGTDTASYVAAAAPVDARLIAGQGFAGEASGDSFSGIENLTGGAFNDVLQGDNSINVLSGGGGNDNLNGLGGNDVLIGDDGNDLLIGGAGADSLNGGAGADTASYVNAGSGVNARLITGMGVSGDAAGDSYSGIENLTGSNFADVLQGDNGANVLIGGSGNDNLNGLDGDDVLNGGAGSDFLVGGAGADSLTGGGGTDTASYVNAGSGVNARLITGTGVAGDANGDTFSGIENLTGGNFADVLQGNNGVNVLIGGGGNDNLNGLGGNDVLNGGDGDDFLVGGTGADSLTGGTGTDTASYVNAGSGVNARLITGQGIAGDAAGDTFSGIENLTGGDFSDVLQGNNGGNVLIGGGGDDNLNGLGGDDVLNGGAGDDFLVGGPGADNLTGGTGVDTASYVNAGSGVNARLIAGAGFAGDAAGDTFSGIENLTGSNFDDLLQGDNQQNLLIGGDGDDNLNGLDQADNLNGGAGDDFIVGGTGSDNLTGGLGNDLFVFRTGDGIDTITDFVGGTGPGDRIFFENGVIAPNVFGDLAPMQSGANTIIDLGGGDMIILLGVTATSLVADDFLF